MGKIMSKDSYWFRHDSTAGRGTRLRKIAFVYGHWGKGIYWDVIEMLRDQSNYSYDCDEFSLKMLADLIGCKDEQKFLNWYKDCIKFELFIEENGCFFSEVLTSNMARWEASKNNGSKGGRPAKKKPKNNLDKTQSKPKHNLNHNLNETIIEEDSIEEKIIEDKETKPKKNFNFRKSLLDLGANEKLVIDWLKVRNKKKASNTETALNSFIKQVGISKRSYNEVLEECVVNSWSGFKADWLSNIKKKETRDTYVSEKGNIIRKGII